MPATPLTGQNIIDNFGAYTGDTTELSTQAELNLMDKIYRKVLNNRPWEFLKKAATGTASLNGNGQLQITLPADFGYIITNSFSSDPETGAGPSSLNMSAQGNSDNGAGRVIFMQTASGIYTPVTVVNFSDRRSYLNRAGYAYQDIANGVLVFTQNPTYTDLTYEFDYIYDPDPITLTTSPVFPARFHTILQHGMAVDDMTLQLFDRAHSYAKENQDAFASILSDMAYLNAQQQMS